MIGGRRGDGCVAAGPKFDGERATAEVELVGCGEVPALAIQAEGIPGARDRGVVAVQDIEQDAYRGRCRTVGGASCEDEIVGAEVVRLGLVGGEALVELEGAPVRLQCDLQSERVGGGRGAEG